MSRTPSTSTQEIQMDMFDHHPHTQVREGLTLLLLGADKQEPCEKTVKPAVFSRKIGFFNGSEAVSLTDD